MPQHLVFQSCARRHACRAAGFPVLPPHGGASLFMLDTGGRRGPTKRHDFPESLEQWGHTQGSVPKATSPKPRRSENKDISIPASDRHAQWAVTRPGGCPGPTGRRTLLLRGFSGSSHPGLHTRALKGDEMPRVRGGHLASTSARGSKGRLTPCQGRAEPHHASDGARGVTARWARTR